MFWTGSIEELYRRSASSVLELRGEGPFARATVIVRDQAARDSFNQALADVSGGSVLGVRPVSLYEMASEVLARSGKPFRRPPLEVVTEAWRDELAADAGLLQPVATLPGTLEALLGLHLALERLDPKGLEALAGSSAVRGAVVEVFGRVQRRLAPLLGARDIFEAATSVLSGEGVGLSDLGPIVEVRTHVLSEAELRFLQALSPTMSFAINVGDQKLNDMVAHGGPSSPLAVPSQVVCASDSDDEARYVVREVQRLLASGTPAHKIAVLHPQDGAYGQIFADLFAAAGDGGISVFGPAFEPSSNSGFAVGALSPLSFDPSVLTRHEFFAWASTFPVRGTQNLEAWEQVAFDSGVSHGRWHRPLTDLAQRNPDSPSANLALELDAFVSNLRAALREGRALRTRKDVVAWYQGFLETYFDPRLLHSSENRAALAATTEGLVDTAQVDLAKRYVASALSSDQVRLAMRDGHAEVPLTLRQGDDAGDGEVLVTGVADLVGDTDNGPFVLDFKTDHVPTRKDANLRAKHHRPQLSVYATAVARALGVAPREVRTFIAFLDPTGAPANLVQLRAQGN